jgi:uncharacterized protein
MSKLSRRELLIFFAGSAVIFGEKTLNRVATSAEVKTALLSFTPVRLAHPLPIYQQQKNFLPTKIGQGEVVNASADVKLTSYNVIGDVVVPPEYERYVEVHPTNKEVFIAYTDGRRDGNLSRLLP